MKKRNKKHSIRKESRMKKENKIILTLAIIILLLFALRIIIKQGDFPDKKLEDDAEKLLNAITANNLKILESDHVDENGIEEISKKDYAALKNNLGLENDFCIHFEDEDGNPIKINGMNVGIGSSKVKINGISCG